MPSTLLNVLKNSATPETIKFWDTFTQTLADAFNSVLLPALNNQLTNVALLGAHVLGGLCKHRILQPIEIL
jgi:hypothetical protein